MPKLSAAMLAELVGSFLLCFFGCGSVAVAVLTGAHQGLWQVASVWGFGIAMTIYATGAISGGHLNPAVTVSMALFRKNDFPASRVLPYISAQLTGGVLAAVTLLVLFGPTCRRFESKQHPPIVRGEPGSQLSAMWLSEYFPNPAIYGTDEEARSVVSPTLAFLAEGVGSALLVFSIFSLTDRRNCLAPAYYSLEPLFIGFTVAIINRCSAHPSRPESYARLRAANCCLFRRLGPHRHSWSPRRGDVGLHPSARHRRPRGGGRLPNAA